MNETISVIGPLNIDLVVTGQGPEDLQTLPDWQGPAVMEMTAAGYTASDLARLGLPVKLSSCVPDDPLGEFLIDTLQKEGVNTAGIRRVPGTLAGISAYLLLFGGRKRPLVYRMPTHSPWPEPYTPAEIDDLLDARVLLNGGYLQYSQVWHGQLVDIFQEARKRGLRTVVDPQFPLSRLDGAWSQAMEDLLPAVDLLLLDETEAMQSTAFTDLDRSAQALLELGPRMVVIKQGPLGSTVYRAGWQYHQPAIRLGTLVDSIGAGDAYDAAFVYAWLKDWPVERCALFASTAAGVTVTGVGGSQTMPTSQQVEILIRSRELEQEG